MSGGGGPSIDTTAQDMYAAVSREMWDDYKRRFVPTEKNLTAYALDSTNDEKAADRAGGITMGQYQIANAGTFREAARYGGMTGDQREAFTGSSNLAAGLDTVDNMNKVREYSKDRRHQVLSRMVNLGRQTKSDALGGMQQSAGLESSRNNTNRQIDAQNDANMISTAGSAAALALMFI